MRHLLRTHAVISFTPESPDLTSALIHHHIAPPPSIIPIEQRALSSLSCGVLRAVVRQTLPEFDPTVYLNLVDDGEGGLGIAKQSLSASPLRVCRYAGADGVAFGSHTDTTFLTVIPCTPAPGLEILQPSTGRWLRPEAAGSCRPDADVMLLAGELLQVFGRGRYRAAVHRVVRPAGLTAPRVSTPFLVRGALRASIMDSMLPGAAVAKVGAEDVAAPADGGGGRGDEAADCKRLSMADLWTALEIRGGATGEGHDEASGGDRGVDDESPLARDSGSESEEEIRMAFARFAPGGVTVLSVDPLLVRLHGFASRTDCDAIMAHASEDVAESTTWVSADVQGESNELRKSATTWIADSSLPLLERLTAMVCGMSGLPSAFMEMWQVGAVLSARSQHGGAG